MDVLGAVDADADVGQAELLEPAGGGPGDQGTVSREDAADALLLGVADELEQVAAQEGLAAGEEDDRRAELGQVIDDVEGLLGSELALVLPVVGVGVAG